MPIHIANCTKQTLRYCYRPPEHHQPLIVTIPSGQQALIGQNWSEPQMGAVITHMERHGFRPASEANSRLKEFSGVFYRIEKPVTESQIHTGHDALVEHQQHRSAQEATRGALAFDSATRDPKDRRRRLARVTEVSVKQDIPPREKPTGDEVNFSLSVDPNGRADAKLPV
jgi:hypothetical protein